MRPWLCRRPGTLRLWDLATGAELRHFEGHEAWVTSVALLVDGRRALSRDENKSLLRLWDLDSGATVAVFTGDSVIT